MDGVPGVSAPVPLRVTGALPGQLLLAGPGGQSYSLDVDDELRAAVQAAQGGPAPLLSPREIQQRLRAGVSAAEVAREAGTSEERVRRWEGPVLAERAAAAAEARATRYARPPDGALSGPLGRLVEQRLASAGLEATWDAWRAEDGSWTVQASHPRGQARWRFDGTTLEALDPAAAGLGLAEERALAAVAPPAEAGGPDGGAENGDGPAGDWESAQEGAGPAGASRRPRRTSLPSWESMLPSGPPP